MPLTNKVVAALLETVAGADVVSDTLVTVTLLETTDVEFVVGAVVVAKTVLLAAILVLVKVVEGTVVTVAVVGGAVVVVMICVALNSEHRARPTDWATRRAVAGQEAIRQGATMEAMADIEGPHWQPSSVSAQPAWEMAEARQAVAQAGSPERFWAVERVRRVVRVRSWSFMVVVV
jgi:hypothetical protein